jgi:4-hydroxybenzoate polyprenyltransferase
LLFTQQFTQWGSITNALQATVLFCLASSATYILNDYFDRDADKKHKTKVNRPIASGKISLKSARVAYFFIVIVLIIWGMKTPTVLAILLLYLVVNVAYSLYLKHQPVLDIFTIAFGFVLRVWAGAQALSLPLSSWMLTTTLSLALYLAALKRRQELRKSGNECRSVLKYYSLDLIDKYAQMSATCTILFYSLYVITHRPMLEMTIPFVLLGLYRYWFLMENKERGEAPTDIFFQDRTLQNIVFIWTALCLYSLWP